MTEAEIKAALGRAVRRAWPKTARASDLPFPDYWKAVTEWLAFQAPHIGDKLLARFIDGFVAGAKEAERRAETPATPKISDEVREIWRRADAQAAWEHAAERADAVRSRFAGRDGKRAEQIAAGAAAARPASEEAQKRAQRPATPMWQGRLL